MSSVAVSVELSNITSQPSDSTTAPKKKTRLVHCSDGVLEVTDESEPESDTSSDTESDAQDIPTPSSAPYVSTRGGSAPSAPDVVSASSLSTRRSSSASLSRTRIRTSERSRRWSTYPERTSCQPEWLVKTNPHELRWNSWFWYYTVFGACKSFDAANWTGEKLAWFFGITTPKVCIMDMMCRTLILKCK